MVVDDAIVLENVTTHIERGSRPKQAAVHATNEVAISVIASSIDHAGCIPSADYGNRYGRYPVRSWDGLSVSS